MKTNLRACALAASVALASGSAILAGPDLIFSDGFEPFDFASIFADGFETGDTSAWTTTISSFLTRGAGAMLEVTADAALAGNFGLQATVNNGAGFVVTNEPNGEPVYRASFLFSPNTLTLADDEATVLFVGRQTGVGVQLDMAIIGVSGGFAVVARAIDDSDTWRSVGAPLSPGTHKLEVELVSATTPGFNDGVLRLYVDDSEQDALTDIDNFSNLIDEARLGIPEDRAQGSGTFYLDDFESFRTLANHPG